MEHHVFFAVFAYDEPHHAISLQLGIEPDETWTLGEHYSAALPEATRTENRWILSSGLDAQASHRDHFERLLLKLERLEGLAEVRRQYRCGIGVSQYFFMDDPTFYLPESLLARFSELGFALSFDQLGLDQDADPETP